jgi:hypothetical protein
MAKTIGGIRSLQINGRTYPTKGAWTVDLGGVMREAIVGADRVHGYKETPKVAFIEGALSATDETDLKALKDTTDATVVLELRDGTAVVLRGAWAAGEFQRTTEESEIAARFEGVEAEEVKL